jgi:hypothetical protein
MPTVDSSGDPVEKRNVVKEVILKLWCDICGDDKEFKLTRETRTREFYKDSEGHEKMYRVR